MLWLVDGEDTDDSFVSSPIRTHRPASLSFVGLREETEMQSPFTQVFRPHLYADSINPCRHQGSALGVQSGASRHLLPWGKRLTAEFSSIHTGPLECPRGSEHSGGKRVWWYESVQWLCLKSQKEEMQQGHSTEHSDFFLFPLLSLPNTDLRYRVKPSSYVLRQVRQDDCLEAVPALLNLLAVSPAKKIHIPSPLESLKCPSPSQTEVKSCQPDNACFMWEFFQQNGYKFSKQSFHIYVFYIKSDKVMFLGRIQVADK